MNKYIYIYFLVDPNDKKVRYIGVTVAPEDRFNYHLSWGHPDSKNAKQRWIGKLLTKDQKPTMLLVAKFTDRKEAEQIEKQLILDFHANQEIYNTVHIPTGKEKYIVRLTDVA